MKTLRTRYEYHTRLLKGHLWAWRNDFEPEELARTAPGEAVFLEGADGTPVGSGFANPLSHIAFRLLDREGRPPDADLLAGRLDQALEWRRRARAGTEVARLVYGESDGLPGFIADRYGPVLVLSQTVAGLEPWTAFLAAELDRRLAPDIILLKNQNRLRLLEGLPLETRVLKGEWSGPATIDLDGCRVVVDCREGRKTGLFLDHRENRRMLSGMLAGGETVLDLFSHCGLWSLAALQAGAARVTAVENDPAAAELARQAAVLNGWQDRLQIAVQDAGEFLRADRQRYGVVVLDPPAFAKKKRFLKDALALYRRFNAAALARAAAGGLFVSSSCSSFVSPGMLLELIREEAADLKCRLQLVAEGTQALDHPVLVGMPETHYLKCFFFRVLTPAIKTAE